MKYLYLLIAAFFFFGNADAQNKCAVLKAKAYYTITQPGNIPVDNNGKQIKVAPSKERVIYITTSCKTEPKIFSLKYGNTGAVADLEKITGSSIILAKDFDGNDIYFRAAKGTYIWKINVQENQSEETDAFPNIYLKVLINKKTQVIRIYSETLLPSPDRP